MSRLTGTAPTAPRDNRPAVTLSQQTRDWCTTHGLDPAEIPHYLATNTGQAADILRLSWDQLARVPKADRPAIIPQEGGGDFLAWFPLRGA